MFTILPNKNYWIDFDEWFIHAVKHMILKKISVRSWVKLTPNIFLLNEIYLQSTKLLFTQPNIFCNTLYTFVIGDKNWKIINLQVLTDIKIHLHVGKAIYLCASNSSDYVMFNCWARWRSTMESCMAWRRSSNSGNDFTLESHLKITWRSPLIS